MYTIPNMSILDSPVCTYRDLVLARACTYTTPFSPRNLEYDLRALYKNTGLVDWSKHTASRTGLVLHGEACKLNGCVKRVAHGLYVHVVGTTPSKAPKRTYERKPVREPKPEPRQAIVTRIQGRIDASARHLTSGAADYMYKGKVELVKCNQCADHLCARDLGEHKRVWHPLNMDNARNTRTIQRERKYGVQGDTSSTDNK